MSSYSKRSISLQSNRMNVLSQPEGFVIIPIGDLEAAIRSRSQRENTAWGVNNISITVDIPREVTSQPEGSRPVGENSTSVHEKVKHEPPNSEGSSVVPVIDSQTPKKSRYLEGENSASAEEITNSIEKELELMPELNLDDRLILRHFVLEEKSFLYHPRFISIGPQHRGSSNLQYMEDYKWSMVRDHFRDSTNLLQKCIECIKDKEKTTRGSYKRNVNLSSEDFVQIMLVDSLFIIIVLAESAERQPDDTSIWDIPNILEDMLLVENQVPFSMIREIWNIVKQKLVADLGLKTNNLASILKRTVFWKEVVLDSLKVKTVLDLAGKFMRYESESNDPDLDSFLSEKERSSELKVNEAAHLLHLWYMWNVPIPKRVSHHHRIWSQSQIQFLNKTRNGRKKSIRTLSATELYEAGIKFKPKTESLNMFDITFEHHTLEIPTLTLDSKNMSFITNLLSYEINSFLMERADRDVPTLVASYVFFMDSLINTKKDVALLQQHDVLNNKLASDDEAASFINTLGESVAIAKVDGDNNFYDPVMKDILLHSPTWRHEWTFLKHKYFNSPWAGISALAGLSLLILTFVQAYYTIYPSQ